ncbi:hypothetical protein DL96DRAFT_1552654 [Flagelloscypha sp. PMI_526]|nr:hypothetical protein DL96DRAFT_1552654 [Flagelloscypha sp. PMI_526]
MRFSLVFGALAALTAAFASPVGNETEPEIVATASFPEDNPFGHVVNGERNKIQVFVENKSSRNVTLVAIGGALSDPENDKVIKNLTTLTYGAALIEGVNMQVSYFFNSEFAPGDLRLNLWVDHVVDDEAYRVSAYDSIVTIVEPEGSIFHYEVISTYLITTVFLGAVGYLAFRSLVPASTKKTRKPRPSEPVGTVTATGPGGYQEEWIPEHHLKKATKRKGTKSAASGDELSGVETSGTEGGKKRGKK